MVTVRFKIADYEFEITGPRQWIEATARAERIEFEWDLAKQLAEYSDPRAEWNPADYCQAVKDRIGWRA